MNLYQAIRNRTRALTALRLLDLLSESLHDHHLLLLPIMSAAVYRPLIVYLHLQKRRLAMAHLHECRLPGAFFRLVHLPLSTAHQHCQVFLVAVLLLVVVKGPSQGMDYLQRMMFLLLLLVNVVSATLGRLGRMERARTHHWRRRLKAKSMEKQSNPRTREIGPELSGPPCRVKLEREREIELVQRHPLCRTKDRVPNGARKTQNKQSRRLSCLLSLPESLQCYLRGSRTLRNSLGSCLLSICCGMN